MKIKVTQSVNNTIFTPQGFCLFTKDDVCLLRINIMDNANQPRNTLPQPVN